MKHSLGFKTQTFIIDDLFYDVAKSIPLCRFVKDMSATAPDGREVKARAVFTVFRTMNKRFFYICQIGDTEIHGVVAHLDRAREYYRTAPVILSACPEFDVEEA